MVDNSVLLGYVKDITVAKMQSWEHSACEKNGKDMLLSCNKSMTNCVS